MADTDHEYPRQALRGLSLGHRAADWVEIPGLDLGRDGDFPHERDEELVRLPGSGHFDVLGYERVHHGRVPRCSVDLASAGSARGFDESLDGDLDAGAARRAVTLSRSRTARRPKYGVVGQPGGAGSCHVTAPVIDLEPVADALDGVNLVQLKVGGVSSDVTGRDAAMTATATQATVELTGPSLGFLDDTILALLDSLGEGLLNTILTIAGRPDALDGFDITGQIQAVLDQIPLLESDQPLIAAKVFGGRATATLDNRDASTTAGGDPPYVELTIAPAVLELLGQDPESGTVRLEAGDSLALPIAGGTPLESTISVGSVTTQDGVTLGDAGLTGSTADASLTTVSLLNIPDVGGIDITLAAASAGVYGAMDVVADPDSDPAPVPDPLPRTGGGVAVGAVLALGTALALRRRRD